jgi:UDP-N-acetylglucosamine diphosphorylase/glucosamine-1-phosphate N-acetyltransferase
MTKNLIVVIMAGGLGKRMNSDLPKVLHCIKGKPMLVRVIEQSLLLKPDKILIIVGKYKDIIIDTLSNYINLNTYINKINFIYQEEPLGTGHAIQCCLPELYKCPKNSTTVILSGDVPLLQHNTLTQFLQNNYQATLMTTLLHNPTGYGRIIEDNNIFNKIVEEKDCLPEEKNVKKVNCGIYAFNTELLCKYIVKIDNNNSQKEYYLTDIIKLIRYNEDVMMETFDIAQEIQYQIMGVNTQEQLTELESFIPL